MDIVATVAQSPEFTVTLAAVTDEQVALIVDELVNFNDLIVDPSVYPLEKRVDEELDKAAFNPQLEHFFNTLYVPYVIARGSRILLEKLDLAQEQLIVERDSLQATDQAIQS